jgi:hypothetical protein
MSFNGSNGSMFAIVSFSLPRARSVTGHNTSRTAGFVGTVSSQYVIMSLSAAERSHLLVPSYGNKKNYYTCSLSPHLNIYDPVLSTRFLIISVRSFASFFPLKETVKLSDGSHKTGS